MFLIVAYFESISAKGSHRWSPDSLTDASTLLLVITTTEFVGALVITIDGVVPTVLYTYQ